MTLFKNVAGAATGLAALLLVATLLASAWFSNRAERVQRVVPHDEATAALLGEVGTPVGRPDDYIIFDENAFLAETAADGARLVSEPFLEENGVYPLQLKTVAFLRNLVATLSLAALVVCGGAWLWLRRRGVGRASAEPEGAFA